MMRVGSLSTSLLAVFTTTFSPYASVLAEVSASRSISKLKPAVEPKTNGLNATKFPLEGTVDTGKVVAIARKLFAKEISTAPPPKGPPKDPEAVAHVAGKLTNLSFSAFARKIISCMCQVTGCDTVSGFQVQVSNAGPFTRNSPHSPEDPSAVSEAQRPRIQNDFIDNMHKYNSSPSDNIRNPTFQPSTKDFECKILTSSIQPTTSNSKCTMKSDEMCAELLPVPISSKEPPKQPNGHKTLRKRSPAPKTADSSSDSPSAQPTDLSVIIAAASAGAVGLILIVVVLVVWLRIRADNRKGYYPASRSFRGRRNTLNLETPVSRYRRTRQIDSTSSFGDCGTPSQLWRRPSQWRRRSGSPPPPLPIPAPVLLKDPVPKGKKLPKQSLTYEEGGSPSGSQRMSAFTHGGAPYSPSDYNVPISPGGALAGPQPPPIAVKPYNFHQSVSPASQYSPQNPYTQHSYMSPIDPNRGLFGNQELEVANPYLRDSYMDGSPPPPRYSAVTGDNSKGKEKVQDMKKDRGSTGSWGSLCEYYYYYA